MSRKTPLILTAVVAVLSTGAPYAQAQAQAATPVQLSYATHDGGRLQIHSVTTTEGDTSRRLRALSRQTGVVAAGVEHTVSATALDPFVQEQYALRLLNGPGTWSYPDAHGAVVAVVDSGVDGTHPDLRGRVLQGAQFLDTGRETSSGNGWTDGYTHGTGVAGIIAAGVNNGVGMAGLARGVRILPVRVLGDNGEGSDVNVARGIIWAVDHGADVVNLSLGDSHYSAVEEQAVNYAAAHNVMVVASAGNSAEDGNPVMYPAAYSNVIAVGAYGENRRRASFSEHGSFVDLSAPGDGVVVTLPGSGYALGYGTSFAAPYVSAAAALVRGNVPRWSAKTVRSVLEQTATDLGTRGRDDEFGHGSVNPVAALARAGLHATTTASLSAPTSVLAGGRLTMRATETSPRTTSVSLQRRSGSGWRTVARVTPNWLGQAAFATTAPASGRSVAYRVVAGAASKALTVALRPVPPRTVSLSVSGRTSSGRVNVQVTVGGGRTVAGVPASLFYRAPWSTSWQRLGAWSTGTNGSLAVTVGLGGGGTWQFRATAEGATSSTVSAG